ncbi:DNA-3-methyladenine glycosylase family protein [Amycolatopsis benzoatilytica]|uniref:DNA-3-methyladenine glycosylase family protein n=1 Tax=Amycolatopsis benzoatilytica TaxID=346045 RepID=UPI000379B01F|nr:DNA-3-methyladenine glycosylase [Amycolatopsis benzoatilytica]
MGTVATLDLPTAEPFDFAASLRFIERFPAMTGEQDSGNGVLVKAIREAGTVVGVRLRAAGQRPGLVAELFTDEPISDAAREAVRDRLTFFLGLDDDLREFYSLAAADPPFEAVVRKLHGYHHVKFPSPLEMLCWSILCQRVPLPAARDMKRALVEACGNEVAVDGVMHQAFPDLEQLLAFDGARWLELLGNQRKADYLHRALPLWAQLSENFLRHGDYDEIQNALLRLPGIGPWSATFLLIRGLGRMERMAPDREALRAAARVYGKPISESEFLEIADRYGPWRGYWGHYLRVGA